VIPKSLVAWPDLSSLGVGLDFTVFVGLGAITAVVHVIFFHHALRLFSTPWDTGRGNRHRGGVAEADGRLPA